MKRTFAYGAATNQGLWPVQEDGFFVDPGAGLFAVADGFGGRGQWDIAAKLALQACRSPEAPPKAGEGGLSPTQAWHRDLLRDINKKILQWNGPRSPAARGGCSLILASVEKERELVLSGCGACSAFLLRLGRWYPLLSPQSAPRRELDGPLFPAQALGLGPEVAVESRSLLWESGDFLFLFSSGLAWETENFLAELGGQAAFRIPGSDLSGMAAVAAEGGKAPGEAPWNQTAVAVEAQV